MKRIISFLKAALIIFAIAFLTVNPVTVADSCRKALELCAYSVIPSLFIYTVASTLCASLFSRFSKSTKKGLAIQTLLGFFSGCAAGCHGFFTLYRNGNISKERAEDMLMLLPACSVPFFLSFCTIYTDSIYTSLLLALSNILACITAYLILCTRLVAREPFSAVGDKKKVSFCALFTSSVTKSALSLINMCSFIIFFRVLSSMVCNVFLKLRLSSSFICGAVSGLCEVTGAVASSTSFDSNARLMFISGVCGFSGLSIIMQVCSICSQYGLSAKSFVLSRLLCTVLSPLYMLALLFILPRTMPVFAFSDFALSQKGVKGVIFAFTLVIILLTVSVFIYIDKKYKNAR